MSSSARTADATAGDPSGLVIVADRYRVHPEEPIPALDGPAGVKAYNVTDERGAPKALFALVCRTEVAPRTDVLNQFSRFNRLPMTSPLRWGVTHWPPERARRFVIILQQPGGERVLPSADATIEPWREDRVVRTVMHPLLPMFKELGDRLLTHRSVRADNLFFADATRETVILGECFSGPPAMAQPSIYEPIDSAMSMPEGRGHGSPADDYYALGVLILVLICGGNPVPDLSEQEIVEAKISKGSYAALVGETRLSLPMVEVLRGLLCDDPEERWRHDDVLLWLNGRHLSPKQALLPPKAARLFPFDGVEYNNASALSNAMGRNWPEALQVIKDNELERWIRRSLSDDVRANAVGAATQAVIGIGGGSFNVPYLVRNGYSTLDAVAIAAAFFLLMTRSALGRAIYAVGINPTASVYAGIDVGRTTFMAFCISGMLAGFCGYLWVSRYVIGSVEVAKGYELTIVAACVIGGISIAGGVGSVAGALLGALFLGVINVALPVINISPFWQMAISGAAIILAVVLNARGEKRGGRLILRQAESAS